MALLRSDTLLNLTCNTCKKYLSYYPIYCEKNAGSICGRCQPSPNAIHNQLYELSVQHSKFPCSFDSNGCLERLIPSEIPEHEKWCKYRTIQCIILNDKCEWKGLIKNLYDHFEKKHLVFILSTKSFEIDFVNSHNENCLLNFGQDLYVVTRSADSKRNIYSCTVNYIGSNLHCLEFSYKLTFKNINGSKNHSMQKSIGETVEVTRKEISDILGDPLSIVVDIEILAREDVEQMEEEYTTPINYEMLKELECLVCFEYMFPPIYQCQTGHSICSNCLPHVKECPTCKSPSIKTQNFALEQIINLINYPCKFDKCKFASKANLIKAHEATCIHSTFKCPLNGYIECNAEITHSQMYDHINNQHYENLLDNDGVTYPFDEDEEFEDTVILRYGKKLFQMHFSYEDRNLYWYVQLIGSAEESNKYMYEVDIQDTTGGNYRIYFKERCGALTAKKDLIDVRNPMFLQRDQIHFVTSQLTFEIRIVEG